MNNPKMRKALLNIHLFLGLGTGLIVFLVAVTGACWVFQEEVQGLRDDNRSVPAQDRRMIAPSVAREIASTAFPGRAVHGTLYGRPDEAVEVIFYEAEPEFYRSVFLDPYDGAVLDTEDHLAGFFAFMLRGHRYLWLPKEIGGPVVKYSILLFLVIITTGLLLWWPKNRKTAKQRFSFQWKPTTRWRRKNFDLHTVTGFYVYALAFVFAFTGSVISFPWLYHLTYRAAGGDAEPRFLIPDNRSAATAAADTASLPMDRLIALLQREDPEAVSFEIHYPHSDSASIYVEVSHREGVYYSSDYRFFDQRTLEEIETPSLYGKYAEADFADKIIRMNYDIHVGAIGGLPGKLIAFIASLLVASLPVTGFLIWLGRRRKKTPRRRMRRQQEAVLS